MSKKNKNQTESELQDETLSKQMLETYLVASERRVAELEKIIKQYKEQEVGIRDQIAVACFAEHFKSTPSYDTAAEDAYKAADAFMRIRDYGKSYEMEVIENIKTFVANIPNDTDLGEKVRRIYK